MKDSRDPCPNLRSQFIHFISDGVNKSPNFESEAPPNYEERNEQNKTVC